MGIASNYWGLPLFRFAKFNLTTPLNSLKRAAAAALFIAAATMLMGAPEVQARYASIVMDFETGQVLQEVNADTRNYPASLVKMMTLYMAFEALNQKNLTLDQELLVSHRAAGMPPSKLGLKAGQTITVREVILALVTKSANDAAVVMAEALGTKETRFAQLMTKKARKLGMRRTSFRNASGLPNRGQLSSARDMAILSRALIRDYPQYYNYFSTDRCPLNGRHHRNHNSPLCSCAGADGLKTGYIRASGFNLAASATRNGRRLIAVVFGGRSPASRDRHVARLLDEGFELIAEQSPLIADAAPPKTVVRAAPALTKNPGSAPEVTAAPEKSVVVASVTTDAAEGSSDTGGAELAWGVQVGAYYRYQLAETAAVKAAASVPDLLGETMVHVPSIRGQRGRIYRARLLGLSETDARVACRQLAAMKTDCLVIMDRSALALKKDGSDVATN